ncbi:MAG: hypothetical protein GY832_26165 [Chloroflexi bacterium]|nr:hypothetical protein [Chloroflexota bacterium]
METTITWHRASTAKHTLTWIQPVLVVYNGQVTTAGWNGWAFWSSSDTNITADVTWFARMPDAPVSKRE